MNEIASRYASALYSLALESNNVDSWQKEIKELNKLLLDNKEFVKILSSSFLNLKQKEELIDKTFSSSTLEIRNLIKIIVKNHREKLLFDIFLSFNSMCNAYKGVKEGLIYSTYKLDEATLNTITNKISEVESIKVELYNKIDTTLIGGVKVVIDGHIYDGSIKSHLEKMKQNLSK